MPSDRLKAERGSYLIIKQKSIETEKTLTYLVQLTSLPSITEPGNFEWYKVMDSNLAGVPLNFNTGTFTYASGLRFDEVNIAVEKTLTNQLVFLNGEKNQANEWSAEVCLQSSKNLEAVLNIDFSNCPSIKGVAQLGPFESANGKTSTIKTDKSKTEEKPQANIRFSIEPEQWFFLISHAENLINRTNIIGFKLEKTKYNEIEYRWVAIDNVSSLESPLNLYQLDYKVGNSVAVEFINDVFFIGTGTSGRTSDMKLIKGDDGPYLLEVPTGFSSNDNLFCATEKSGSNDFFGFSLEYCTSLASF